MCVVFAFVFALLMLKTDEGLIVFLNFFLFITAILISVCKDSIIFADWKTFGTVISAGYTHALNIHIYNK